MNGRAKVAILGSGNIGTDLLKKTARSSKLECTLFVGRNPESPGMKVAREMGIQVSDKQIDAIVDNAHLYDIVFDATSAYAHAQHAGIFKNLGKFVIDMTPSKIGEMCVPAVNLNECLTLDNVNMVTCGGQASVPIAYAIGQTHRHVDYIEVVSSIASRSAGPATRSNLDEYIETTEEAIVKFSRCRRAKAILNLNPAEPCIDMQTTVYAKVSDPDPDALSKYLEDLIRKMQSYVPGYRLLLPPTLEDGKIVVMIKVQGLGDYLPKYAGNLDIINCAAVAIAEEYAFKIGNARKGA
ncbi:acetaldehyde dehydrogenase (acetylating) [Cohnella zeiphila]|uniref:Acetaldehyde dehydrogenase n=1 Tax=Cohnella zeiphila TaxID=2761120 RepID=A0A7X0SMR0_9BACL|nr:acetaldehyde dehydrogenase (acetylating) [Cohnella zeiphila]MBB6731565.1 acetaldehyde dehydrogenase (acetylating) [Cohnella zeiphila]